MTYQEAACVVSDSKNDVPYQMAPPESQYMVIKPPFFLLLQMWEMLTQPNLYCLVPYQWLPHF